MNRLVTCPLFAAFAVFATPTLSTHLPANPLIVSVGDSITGGYKASVAYPELLADDLHAHVTNLAVGGLTAVQAATFQMPPLRERCRIGTLFLGGNDAGMIIRGGETLPQFSWAMRIVSNRMKARCDRVFVATVPNYSRPVLMAQLNRIIEGLGFPVVDLNADHRLENGRNFADGVHPNDAGQRIIAEDFARTIARVFRLPSTAAAQ